MRVTRVLAEERETAGASFKLFATPVNRRINSMLYIASVTQQRFNSDAGTYLDRKIGEGRTHRAARRAHKRHLASRVIRRMWNDEERSHVDTWHVRARKRRRALARSALQAPWATATAPVSDWG